MKPLALPAVSFSLPLQSPASRPPVHQSAEEVGERPISRRTLVWNKTVPRPSTALAGAPAIPRSGIAKRPRQRSPLAASRAAMYSSRRSTGMMAHGQRSPPASRSSGTGRCARCRPDRDGRGRTGSARARHERKAPAHRAEGRRTPASRHGPRTDSAARASNAGCRRGCYGIRQGRPGAQDPRPRWGRTSPGTRSGGLPRRPFRGSRLRPPGGRCRARPWYACQ